MVWTAIASGNWSRTRSAAWGGTSAAAPLRRTIWTHAANQIRCHCRLRGGCCLYGKSGRKSGTQGVLARNNIRCASGRRG